MKFYIFYYIIIVTSGASVLKSQERDSLIPHQKKGKEIISPIRKDFSVAVEDA
jgi:hypothetical protein